MMWPQRHEALPQQHPRWFTRALSRALLAFALSPYVCALPAASSPAPIPCAFSFPEAFVSFDLSPISAVAFTLPASVTDTFAYKLQFCGLLSGYPCPPTMEPSSAFRANAEGGCQQSFGRANNATARLLGDGTGVAVTYQSDEVCSGGSAGVAETYWTTVNVLCDASLTGPDSLKIIERTDSPDASGCGIIFKVASAAGCGIQLTRLVQPLGAGWIVFSCVVGLGAVYLGGGVLYKRRTLGARGLEAVPHIGLWRAMFHAVTCGQWRGGWGGGSVDYSSLADGDKAGAEDAGTARFI